MLTLYSHIINTMREWDFSNVLTYYWICTLHAEEKELLPKQSVVGESENFLNEDWEHDPEYQQTLL